MSLSVHDGIEEWLPAAVTDGLLPEERQVFDAHLAGCARCRELFTEETAMSQTIQNAFDTVRPLPGFERRLTSAFRQRRESGVTGRLLIFAENVFHTPAARVLGATALVLALVALGGGLTQELPWETKMIFPGKAVDLTPPVFTSLDAPKDQVAPLVGTDTRSAAADRPRVVIAMPVPKDAGSSFNGLTSRSSKMQSPVSPFPAPITETASRRATGTLEGPPTGATFNLETDKKESPSFAKAKAIATDRFISPNKKGGSTIYGSDAVGGAVNAAVASPASPVATASAATPSTDLDRFGGITLDQNQMASKADVGGNQAATGGGAPGSSAATLSPPAEPAIPGLPAAPPLPPPPEPSTTRAVGTPDNRKLIRNANVELEVASFDPAVDALGAAASQVGGGYVATVDSSKLPNGKRRGTIVLKVLPDHLDAFLARLKELGEVKSQNISTQDVTKDYFDTDARLRNSRRMEDRLLKILDDDKGKLAEILQVEKELGRVREDIEKMQGELQLYDALVRFATVTIDLYEKDLQQPATFLLRQTADLSLLCTDVEKTYTEARHIADDVHAQIESSDLTRADDGHVSATLRLLLQPETADSVIARLKASARVENFKLAGERTAENGDATDTSADTDLAKLKRGPVTLNLSIGHDEETHRRVTLTVTTAGTSPAFDKTRDAALAVGAEIVSANFTRTQGAHGSGVLALRLPAKQEASLLETVRTLGHTSDLNVQRDNNIAPDADTAPTLLTLNFADERISRSISLTLIAHDLDAAFEKIRVAALAAGAEITNSNLVRSQGSAGSGQLAFRLPAAGEDSVLAAVHSLGRTLDYTVQRDPSASDDEKDHSPVSLTINIADQETPVQQTEVAVLCAQVSKRQAEVRKIAADAGAQVRSSSFDQSTDGGEQAALVFDLPLSAYDGFLSRVKSLGEITSLNVHRQDRPEAKATGALNTAPAEVSLRLYSQGPVVSDQSGLGATLRHTLGQGVDALMWSLRMIGVALAFLAPWVFGLLLVIWLTRFFARRREQRKNRETSTDQRPS